MRFIIPINEVEVDAENTSVTCYVVETDTDVARTNKRLLKEFLIAYGVKPTEIKKALKSMGFWGKALGR